MSNVINATYVSAWDDYNTVIETECKVNLDTGVIFDIGTADADNVENLDREYITFGDREFDVDNDGDEPVVMVDELAALVAAVKASQSPAVKPEYTTQVDNPEDPESISVMFKSGVEGSELRNVATYGIEHQAAVITAVECANGLISSGFASNDEMVTKHDALFDLQASRKRHLSM